MYLPKSLPCLRFGPGPKRKHVFTVSVSSHKDAACATFLHAHGLTCCRLSCAIFDRKTFLGLRGGGGGEWGGGVSSVQSQALHLKFLGGGFGGAGEGASEDEQLEQQTADAVARAERPALGTTLLDKTLLTNFKEFGVLTQAYRKFGSTGVPVFQEVLL